MGAADARLLAACGLDGSADDLMKEDGTNQKKLGQNGVSRESMKSAGQSNAPDAGLAPLSLPFVIVNEARQSVEPATLIPLNAGTTW
jgi:hypothetical protein